MDKIKIKVGMSKRGEEWFAYIEEQPSLQLLGNSEDEAWASRQNVSRSIPYKNSKVIRKM